MALSVNSDLIRRASIAINGTDTEITELIDAIRAGGSQLQHAGHVDQGSMLCAVADTVDNQLVKKAGM